MATRNPNSFLSFTLLDYSDEKSIMTFSAVEYNVLTFVQYLTDIGDFRNALQLVSGGAILAERVTLFDTKYDPVKPTNPVFQREDKWQVTIKDDVTFAIYQVEIPIMRATSPATATPPSELLLVDGTDKANLSATAWVTFVNALEQVYRTKDGNFGTVLRIDRVSRNL